MLLHWHGWNRVGAQAEAGAITLGARVVAMGVFRLCIDFGGRTDKIFSWIRWDGSMREKEKSKLTARFGAGASGTKEWLFIEMGRK